VVKSRRTAMTTKLRKGDLDGAMTEYAAMRAEGLLPLKLELYNEVLNKCVSLRRPEVAAAVFGDMEAEGVCPDEGSYCALIRGAVAAGDPEGGMELLEEMQHAGIRSRLRSYATLLRFLSQGAEMALSDARPGSSAASDDNHNDDDAFPAAASAATSTAAAAGRKLALAIRVWRHMRAERVRLWT
jgi:pentatricopeptide repeat protein